MLNEFEDQDYVETAPQAFSDEKSRSTTGWNELAAQQRADRETAAMAENQKLFDGFVDIEAAARQRKVALDRQRAVAGAAMMESAFRNGGMSDRALSDAFSQAFGMPVYGGQLVNLGKGGGLSFVMYGAAKDPQTGEAKIAPVAMMDGVQMSKVLQQAGLGDRTADLQKSIYGDLSSRLTKDQLGKMGVQNPSAPISTGGAVISAAGMRALRGEPRPRSTIGVFSNVGGDGKIGTGTRSATIRPDGTREEVLTGTRDPEHQGKWKVLESNAEGKRYENDKTGEEVFVPKGESLGDILSARQRKAGSGLTFDERRQLQQESEDRKDARAQASRESRKETEEERSRRHLEGRKNAWRNTRYNAIQRQLDTMRKAKTKDAVGKESPKYTEEEIAAKEKELYDQMDADYEKAFPSEHPVSQAPASSGDNNGNGTTTPTVAKDGNSITMPGGKVVKKGETFTDSKGRTMKWVGPGMKDWQIVK